MMADQRIFLVTQKDVEQENPALTDLFSVGIIAEIKQVIKLQNDVVRVLVEGKTRAEVAGFTDREAYLEAEIVSLEIPEDELPENFDRRYLGWIDTPENRKAIADYCARN